MYTRHYSADSCGRLCGMPGSVADDVASQATGRQQETAEFCVTVNGLTMYRTMSSGVQY